MSAVVDQVDVASARRNVALLAVCQALLVSSASILIATSGLIGARLAPNAALATIPLGAQFLAMMATAMPASLYMRRVGRRNGFLTGAAIGIGGAVLCTFAIIGENFVLFCAGSALFGVYTGFGQFYRFAAADAAGSAFRARAISAVLAGGVVAAFIGPNLARATRDSIALHPFAGSYLALIGLGVLASAVLAFVHAPPPVMIERHGGRSLGELAAQPRYVVAVLGAMVGYGSMNLLMTATPLAMSTVGFQFGAVAFVIQSHVLGMFVPSFVTGRIIRRFGELEVMLAGAALLALCIAANLGGSGRWNFVVALVLLGVGWNFLFIGATTLLTETYRSEEMAKAQGLNDLLVFGTVALTALSSGALYHLLGWRMLNLGVGMLIAVAVLAIGWLKLRERR